MLYLQEGMNQLENLLRSEQEKLGGLKVIGSPLLSGKAVELTRLVKEETQVK